MSRAFLSRYPSRCPACSESIEDGELVRYVGTVVVHDDCDRPAPPGGATKFQGTTLEEMGF